jgi:hypothetical protein
MTYEELKATGFVLTSCCSICDAPIGYQIHPDYAAVVFQSACDCPGSQYPNYRAATHEELAGLKAGDAS